MQCAINDLQFIGCSKDLMIKVREVLKSVWHTVRIYFLVVWQADTNPCHY